MAIQRGDAIAFKLSDGRVIDDSVVWDRYGSRYVTVDPGGTFRTVSRKRAPDGTWSLVATAESRAAQWRRTLHQMNVLLACGWHLDRWELITTYTDLTGVDHTYPERPRPGLHRPGCTCPRQVGERQTLSVRPYTVRRDLVAGLTNGRWSDRDSDRVEGLTEWVALLNDCGPCVRD